jgi:hypothetical protein
MFFVAVCGCDCCVVAVLSGGLVVVKKIKKRLTGIGRGGLRSNLAGELFF